jgi:periplasmic protein TonB
LNTLRPLSVQEHPGKADAAARVSERYGRFQATVGWVGAVALHGVLLAAVIFSWPSTPSLAPPDGQSISLIIEHPAAMGAGKSASVQPKPAGEKVETPQTPPAMVANTSPKPIPVLPHSVSQLASRLAPKFAAVSSAVPQTPGDKGYTSQIGGTNSGVSAPEPIGGSANQPPDYPWDAQLHGEEGKVLLSINVLPDGRADSVKIVQSSGFKSLDKAAADAIMKWRFQPGYKSGQPVTSVLPYQISFNLN